MNATSSQTPALLVRLGSRCCALPLENVVETMRPLPTEPIQNMPAFVCGLATIRGSPVPVVDLDALFGGKSELPISRFVLLRVGDSRVAVAVEEVLGVRHLDNSALQGFPPLLQDAYQDLVEAIEVRDHQFLFVLRSTHLVPNDVWQRLESSEANHDRFTRSNHN